MLGLDFYRKVEKLMNKKYVKKCYHSDGYFCIDKIEINCIEGELTPENCLITLSIRWGVEGSEKYENKREYSFHRNLKTVKQVCEALYTIIEFCEQIL